MFLKLLRNLLRTSLTVVLAITVTSIARADQWVTPTSEELAMTSVPQAPGASAVYLFREDTQEDYLHMYTRYVRLKVLTEGGRERANVDLKFWGRPYFGAEVTDISGRTIHPDGTIIPFTGKPYDHVIAKTQSFEERSKVFTLPDVTVGSIIEYRYKLRWDEYFRAPIWVVQDDVYLLKGHFLWHPTDSNLRSGDDRRMLEDRLAWTPLLPAGLEVKMTTLPVSTFTAARGTRRIELDVRNIAPSPQEEYMPPVESLGYRVMFYYTGYATGAEFWNGEGNYWSKIQDKFIGPGGEVRAAVAQLIGGGGTQDQQLRKLYAAVEELENTSYTRKRSRAEDKAEGLHDTRTAEEIWVHKRGNNDEITKLFVAMARVAGMKAYVMRVTNRDRSIFLPTFRDLRQLNDDIAIVTVDGKERFFDPGSRYCPYGHLEWKHSEAGGLRQDNSGSSLSTSPAEKYTDSATTRVANLTMDQTGAVAGRLEMKYIGSPSLRWRQMALTDDADAVEREMKESVEQMLPGGMEVQLVSITRLQDYEQPLTVSYQIKGPVGSATGKRLLIPADLFEGNAKPIFAHEKRELAVYFPFRYNQRDSVRINLPQTFQVESVPPDTSTKMSDAALYQYKASSDAQSVTVHRNLVVGELLFTPKEYPDLKTFYTQFEAKDQEPIILKVAAPAPAGN